jgi:hypothetical protein
MRAVNDDGAWDEIEGMLELRRGVLDRFVAVGVGDATDWDVAGD